MSFEASGWAGGGSGGSGGTFGLRFSAEVRDAHFDRAWSSVTLVVPSGEQVEAPISPAFWKRCTEVRSAKFGAWMRAQGLAPWPRGKPPKFEIRVLGPGRFAVWSIE